jgi:hypothetical protein
MGPNTNDTTNRGVTPSLEKSSVRSDETVQEQQQQQQQRQRQQPIIHVFDDDDSDDDVMDGIFDDDDNSDDVSDDGNDNDNNSSTTSPFMKLIPTAYFIDSPTRKMMSPPPPKSTTTFTASTTDNNNVSVSSGNINGNGTVQHQHRHQHQHQHGNNKSASVVPFPTTSPPQLENEKGVDRLLLLARYPYANEQNIQLTLQKKQIQKEAAIISATKKAQSFRNKQQQQQQQYEKEQEQEQQALWKQQQRQEEHSRMQQQQQPLAAVFQPGFFGDGDDVEEGRFHFHHVLHDINSTNTTTNNNILPRRSKDSSGTDNNNDNDNDNDNDNNDETITEYDTATAMMWQQQQRFNIVADNNTTTRYSSSSNNNNKSLSSNSNSNSSSRKNDAAVTAMSGGRSRRRSSRRRSSFKNLASNFMEKVFPTTATIEPPPIPPLDNDNEDDSESQSQLPIITTDNASASQQSVVSASDDCCSLYTDIGSRGGDTTSSKYSNPNSVITRKISNITTSNMNDYDNMHHMNHMNQNRIIGNSESTAHRSTDDHGDESNNNNNNNNDDDSGGSGSGSKKGLLLFLRLRCGNRKKKSNGLLIFILSLIIVIAIMVTVLSALKGRRRRQQQNNNNNNNNNPIELFLQPSQSPSTVTIPSTITMLPSIGATETATPTVKPPKPEMASSSSTAAAAAADNVAESSSTSSTTDSDNTNLILQVPTNRPTSNTNSQSPTTKVVSLLPTSNPKKQLFSTWTWSDLGVPMMGTELNQQYGQSVAISHDGTIMAIGAPYALSQSGVVRIYQLSKDGTGWISIASFIGRNEGDQFGSAVSLSADGSVLAVSEPTYNGIAGDKTGNVRTYVYSPFGSYIRLGQDIEGDSATDHLGLGLGLALSSNGRRLAVGAPYRDNSGSINNDSSRSNRLVSGAVKVYEWSIPTDKWIHIIGDNNNIDDTTAQLIGTSDLDWFGWSLDLNDDGSLLCVGAPRNSDFGGYVQCFEEQKEDSFPFNIQWTLVGDTIRNSKQPVRYDDTFGAAISVSRDPTGTRHRVAIAAPGKNGPNNSIFDSGIVIVYEFNPNNPERGWIQLGRTEITSVNPGKDFQMGYSIDLHGDLLLVGVPGATNNDGGGQMELFEFETSSWHWKRQPRIFQGLTGSNFGSAVRMTPDGSTVVVGSPRSEENNYGGAINVYRKD